MKKKNFFLNIIVLGCCITLIYLIARPNTGHLAGIACKSGESVGCDWSPENPTCYKTGHQPKYDSCGICGGNDKLCTNFINNTQPFVCNYTDITNILNNIHLSFLSHQKILLRATTMAVSQRVFKRNKATKVKKLSQNLFKEGTKVTWSLANLVKECSDQTKCFTKSVVMEYSIIEQVDNNLRKIPYQFLKKIKKKDFSKIVKSMETWSRLIKASLPMWAVCKDSNTTPIPELTPTATNTPIIHQTIPSPSITSIVDSTPKVEITLTTSPIVTATTTATPTVTTTATSIVNENASCNANSSATWKDCIRRVQSGLVYKVFITGTILCTGPNACAVDLSGVSNNVLIIGSNVGSGFRRTDHYNYPIININNSSYIKIQNIRFDETEMGICIADCTAIINIGDSKKITLSNLSLENSKLWALSILNSQDIDILDSRFISPHIYGIWVPYLAQWNILSKSIHIERNLFQDSRSVAITFSGHGTSSNPSTISNNTFIHNHNEAVFNYSGGQMVVESNTNHLKIENNILKDGNVSTPGAIYYTNGIEFTQEDFSNILVRGNTIFNNTGWGIVKNGGPDDYSANISNIIVTENHVYNNGQAAIVFPGAIISSNCLQPGSCTDLPTSSISASPNPCQISNNNTCSSYINWNSSQLMQIWVGSEITPNQGLFGCGYSGNKVAPWITNGSQAIFRMYIAKDCSSTGRYEPSISSVSVSGF